MGIFDFLTGADEQAKAIKKATNQALAYQQQGQDKADSILQPGSNFGPLQSKLYDLVGMNGGQAQQDAYGSYAEGPDVAFQRQQAEQAAQRGASAGGHLASGRTMTDLAGYATGLARQGFGDWYSRLRDLFGSALNTAGARASGFSNNGSRLSELAMGGGQQYAQAKGEQGGVLGNLLSQGAALAAYAAGGGEVGTPKPGAGGSAYPGYSYYGGAR